MSDIRRQFSDHEEIVDCQKPNIHAVVALAILKQIVRAQSNTDTQQVALNFAKHYKSPVGEKFKQMIYNIIEAQGDPLTKLAWVDQYFQTDYANDVIKEFQSICSIDGSESYDQLTQLLRHLAGELGVQINLFDQRDYVSEALQLPTSFPQDSLVVTILKDTQNKFKVANHMQIANFDRGNFDCIIMGYPFIQPGSGRAIEFSLSPEIKELLKILPQFIGTKTFSQSSYDHKLKAMQICEQLTLESNEFNDIFLPIRVKIQQLQLEEIDEDNETGYLPEALVKVDEPPKLTCEKCGLLKNHYKDWGLLYMTCTVCNYCILDNYCTNLSRKCPCGKPYCSREYINDELDAIYHAACKIDEFRNRLPNNRFLD